MISSWMASGIGENSHGERRSIDKSWRSRRTSVEEEEEREAEVRLSISPEIGDSCSVQIADSEITIPTPSAEAEVPEVIKINDSIQDEETKDCRICHLSLENILETGVPIELGCSCKEDLAAAHKQCAEAWFKIKGNRICEICGVIAKNVVDASDINVVAEQSDETNNTEEQPPPLPPVQSRGTRSFWHGHRFLNFMLACVVFAFVISWMFHFNMPH